jgi:hypothetical protein
MAKKFFSLGWIKIGHSSLREPLCTPCLHGKKNNRRHGVHGETPECKKLFIADIHC